MPGRMLSIPLSVKLTHLPLSPLSSAFRLGAPSSAAHPCTLHGVATWFDVLFDGSTSQRWLSTAPGLPSTHWFQLRCVLQQPLVVLTPNSKLTGCLHLVAHERQSYDIHLELEAPPVGPGMPPQKVRLLQDSAAGCTPSSTGGRLVLWGNERQAVLNPDDF